MVRSCHRALSMASVSMWVTRVSNSMESSRGAAQVFTNAFMPGLATQCGSRAGKPAAATRPRSSSTCTMLALQGRQVLGVVCRASTKRGSRTVKYCAPWSKVPNGLLRVDMRPPTPWLFSKIVTLLPACTRVRAQVMAARPPPTMAMFLGTACICSPKVGCRSHCTRSEGASGVVFTRVAARQAVRRGWWRCRVAAATIARRGPGRCLCLRARRNTP